MASSRNLLHSDARFLAVTTALADCLKRHVQPGERLLVGLSGGTDSVVLLHALAATNATNLSALHVHHGLSRNADNWASFCAQTAQQLGIPFRVAHVVVERGTSDGLEASARRARHAVFAAATADWVVLAHHRDDQAETLLFNLLRGTGLAGAAAMRERNGRLLRPLLSVGRAEIESYARQHALEWIEDESNRDTRHTRNFLRHRILAPLTQRFPAAQANLAAATSRFAEALDLLDSLARADLGTQDDFPLALEILQRLDEPRARNVLRYLLARHEVPIPSEARLREALRQMLAAGADRHPALVLGQHRLLRRRGKVYLEPFEPSNDSR